MILVGCSDCIPLAALRAMYVPRQRCIGIGHPSSVTAIKTENGQACSSSDDSPVSTRQDSPVLQHVLLRNFEYYIKVYNDYDRGPGLRSQIPQALHPS